MAKALWFRQTSPEATAAARYGNGGPDARGRTHSAMIETRTTRKQPVPRGRFTRWRPFRVAAAIALITTALSACTGEQFQKGYILPPGALEQIPIGASQDQVLIVMGTPSTVATLNGEVFYYISQRAERPIMFMNQRVIDQRVIAIYFDKNRQVVRLANYGLKDGKIFDFISRTTPTSGQEISYLTPLFKLLSFN
jgi:outer membrane protein assembly factor BamE (lipoprotein component of BamABCDE complex)